MDDDAVAAPAYVLKVLTKCFAAANTAEILSLSDDLAWDDWTETHLLSDRPGKWRHSRYVTTAGGALIAYAIISERDDALHLHHIIVKAAYRSRPGRSIGGLIIDDLLQSGRSSGAKRVTLKVMAENARAVPFYLRRGFAEQTSDDPQVRSLTITL